MLHYALVFFVIAIIAAVLGFGGIAGAATGVAKILFLVFLVLAVISLLTGRKPAGLRCRIARFADARRFPFRLRGPETGAGGDQTKQRVSGSAM